MNKNHVVSFIGIDGSGKTSNVDAIISHLTSMGIMCKKEKCGAAIRIFTLPVYVFLNFLGFKSKYANKKHIHTSRFPPLYKNAIIKLLWYFAVFLDLFILIIFRVKIHFLFFLYIFLDRSIYDVFVELSVVAKNDDALYNKFARVLHKFLNSDMIFLIDVDENKAFLRKKDVPDIFYLKQRRKKYLKLRTYYPIHYIDGNRPLNIISEELNNIILANLDL